MTSTNCPGPRVSRGRAGCGGLDLQRPGQADEPGYARAWGHGRPGRWSAQPGCRRSRVHRNRSHGRRHLHLNAAGHEAQGQRRQVSQQAFSGQGRLQSYIRRPTPNRAGPAPRRYRRREFRRNRLLTTCLHRPQLGRAVGRAAHLQGGHATRRLSDPVAGLGDDTGAGAAAPLAPRPRFAPAAAGAGAGIERCLSASARARCRRPTSVEVHVIVRVIADQFGRAGSETSSTCRSSSVPTYAVLPSTATVTVSFGVVGHVTGGAVDDVETVRVGRGVDGAVAGDGDIVCRMGYGVEVYFRGRPRADVHDPYAAVLTQVQQRANLRNVVDRGWGTGYRWPHMGRSPGPRNSPARARADAHTKRQSSRATL